VGVEGTEKLTRHELTRENTLTQEQLDAWRQYVTGIGATDAPATASPAQRAGGVSPSEAEEIPFAEVDEDEPEVPRT
jgi:hypothetical protein